VVDVLLIHPTRTLDQKSAHPRSLYMFVPMGLLAIADLLDREGISSKIINYPLEQALDRTFALTKVLKQNEFKICGIDLHWVMHSHGAMEIAKIVKKINPNAKVVLGGYTATYYHDEIMQYYPAIDAIIRGEGEIPFLKYCQATLHGQSLDSVPNLTYRDPTNHIKVTPLTYLAETLDELNFTNISLLQNGSKYIEQSKKIMRMPFNLMIGRGCPFNCPYCGGGRTAQLLLTKREKILFRTPERIIDDLNTIVGTYKADAVIFGHGIYPTSFTYWETLFKLIRKEKLDLGADLEIWRFPFPKTMWHSFSKTFRHTNSSLSICPQTLSPTSQYKVRILCDPTFNFPIDQIQNLIQNANLFQIVLRIWFTIGFPFQNFKTILADYLFTLKQALQYGRTKPNFVCIMNDLVHISPASPAFETPEQFQLKLLFKTFRQNAEIYKRTKYRLGGWNSVTNYCTAHSSAFALRIWNNAFNVTEIPLFMKSFH
jgi:effector-binding domain-containing protein